MRLSLAGNDDNGNWRGAIDACQVASLSLSGDDVPCVLIGGGRLKFGADLIVPTTGYIPWHGSMAWDSFRVHSTDAVRVIEYLRTQHWTCEEGEEALFDAYEHGLVIDAVLLENSESFADM